MQPHSAFVCGLIAVQLLLLPAAFAAAPAPADEASDTTSIRLAAVRMALDQAATTLHEATVATHGGFVEKGLEDLAQALSATDAALELARNHPDSGALPAPASPAADAALIRIDAMRQPAPAVQPSMYRTLAALKAALVALQTVPGGDLGGAREKLITSMAQAADDIINGIQFVQFPDRVPPSGRGPAASAPFVDLAGYFPAPANASGASATPAGPLRFVAGPASLGPQMQSQQISHPIESFRGDFLAGGLETAKPLDAFIYTTGGHGVPFAHVIAVHGKITSAGQFMGKDVPRALNEVVVLEQVKSGVFEPRLLEFGGLWTVLWLKSVTGGPDYLYPVAETARPEDPVARKVRSLEARTLYSVEDFLAAVRPELEARRDAPRQNPQGRGGG